MDRTKKMSYSSQELVELYQNTSSGHFFDKDTMRFFNSRLSDSFKRVDDSTAYFITTERAPMASDRKASIRKATIVNYTREDGDVVSKVEVETVGEFNKMTLAQAKSKLKKI